MDALVEIPVKVLKVVLFKLHAVVWWWYIYIESTDWIVYMCCAAVTNSQRISTSAAPLSVLASEFYCTVQSRGVVKKAAGCYHEVIICQGCVLVSLLWCSNKPMNTAL